MPRRRRPPTTPYDIEIRTNTTEDDYDPEHAELTIHGAHTDFAAYTYADTLNGYRWVAGTLGRLAVTLADDIADARRTHGCRWNPPAFQTGCHLSGTLDDLTDMTDPPRITICIARPLLDDLTRQATQQLNAITTADAWHPTPDDERAWLGDDTNITHLNAHRDVS